MALDLREVWTISSNEFRCLLRDRHTFVYSVLLPFLLYPALFIGATQAVTIARGARERRVSRIGVIDEGAFPDLTSFLAGREKVRIESLPVDRAGNPGPMKDSIREGEIDAVVLPSRVEGGSIEAKVFFSEASDASRTARERIESALAELRGVKLKERARELGEAEGLLETILVREVDISSVSRRAWEALARILPLLIILMVTLGALYPALDATVGERERGTIETTLLEPVDWSALVLGKYLPVAVLAIMSAFLNFTNMWISLWIFLLRAKVEIAALAVSVESILWTGAGVVILAFLVGAVMMSVALSARSFKEGQSYLGGILLVAMIPGFASAVPDVQLDALTAVTPVLDLALVVRESLRGKLDPALGFLSLAAAAIHAALAIFIASRLVRRETVLLGEPSARPTRRGLLGALLPRRSP